MDFLFYLFKASLLLGIFGFSYKVLLSKETFYTYNRVFLLSGIIISLLLPLCIVTNTVYVTSDATFLITDSSQFVTTSSQESGAAQFFDWQSVLIALYSIGVVGMFSYFLWQLAQVYLFLKNRSKSTDKGLNYIQTDEDLAPFSFLKNIVYNPKSHSIEELSFILKHEETHARQAHTYDLLATKLYCALFWFNPLAWWYARLVEQNLELIADAEASSSITVKQYQLALVKQVTGKTVPGLTQSFYKSFLKKRIMMLSKPSSCNRSKLKVLVLLPCLAVFLWSFNIREERINRKVPLNRNNDHEESQLLKTDSTDEQSVSKSVQTDTVATLTESQNTAQQQNKSFRFEIDSNTTEEELEALATKLESDYRVQLNYTNLNYDEEGILISVNLKMKDLRSRSTSKLNLENTDGLGTIIMFKNDDGALGFQSSRSSTTTQSNTITRSARSTQEDTVTQSITGTGKRTIAHATTMSQYHDSIAREYSAEAREIALQQREEALKAREQQLEERRKMIEARNKEVEAMMQKQKDTLKKNFIVVSGNTENKDNKLNDDVLYILDGEEITKEDMEQIKPEDIKAIHVLKDENALKKYGDKAKDGVVEIILKEEENE